MGGDRRSRGGRRLGHYLPLVLIFQELELNVII